MKQWDLTSCNVKVTAPYLSASVKQGIYIFSKTAKKNASPAVLSPLWVWGWLIFFFFKEWKCTEKRTLKQKITSSSTCFKNWVCEFWFSFSPLTSQLKYFLVRTATDQRKQLIYKAQEEWKFEFYNFANKLLWVSLPTSKSMLLSILISHR